jgi:hypothetical protein
MPWVVAFGSREFDPVVEGLRAARVTTSGIVHVLPASERKTLNPVEFSGSFEEALPLLRAFEIVEITIQNAGEEKLLVQLTCPSLLGDIHKEWTGWVDQIAEKPQALFDALLQIPGLTYCLIAIDDNPCIDVPYVDVETFPWGYWGNRVAAVRRRDGTWDIRSLESGGERQ